MYCPKCGQQNDDNARFCVKCAAQLPFSAAAAEPASGATGIYAGFWKRFAAVVIDYLILVASAAVVGGIVGFIYGASSGSFNQKSAEGLGNIAGILVWWLYYALMESSSRQATLGKMALGIKVVDQQGRRVSFGRATGRHFAKLLSGLILMIGYLMAGFTAKKQALHDMMAGCLVVNRGATEEAVRQGAPAARMPVWAIALIVLAAIVFPVGILAAIAIPAYHDYTVRARVAGALQVGNQATRAVEDFYLRNKTLPRDIREAGMKDPVFRDVRRVSVDSRTGAVEVVLAAAPLEGKSIVLTPQRENNNRITWICSSSDIRGKYLPARCRK
ncbi:MAG: RDD family protein [Betaproteobacteria bacterium]|nr:RDD family protein [Betaproteobacteria bacterium]